MGYGMGQLSVGSDQFLNPIGHAVKSLSQRSQRRTSGYRGPRFESALPKSSRGGADALEISGQGKCPDKREKKAQHNENTTEKELDIFLDGL